LVELARCKKATGQNKHLVELIDDGGFADARIAGNEHQLRRAALQELAAEHAERERVV